MNNQRHSCQEWIQRLPSWICSSCISWLPCLQRQHQVHPELDTPANSHYVCLGPHRRVRVIHIERNTTSFPANVKRLSTIRVVKSANSKRNSVNFDVVDGIAKWKSSSLLSNGSDGSIEEYWFTRWSRPLKLDIPCNCSFKKSQNKSLENSGPKKVFEESKPRDISSLIENVFKTPDRNSKDLQLNQNSSSVEKFVDNLLEKLFFEVFVHMKQEKTVCDYALPHTSTNHVKLQDNCDKYEKITVNKNDIGVSVEGYINPSFLGSLNNPDVLYGSSQETSNAVHSDKKKLTVRLLSITKSQNTSLGVKKADKHHKTKDSSTNQKHSANSNHKNLSHSLKENDLKLDSIEKKVSWPAPCCQTLQLPRLKPVLYFLHGIGSSADLWAALVQYFTCSGYEVVAPDMLGHGYSAAPDITDAYTFENLLKDAVDVFDKFVGDRRAVVIGHAFGCSLAAALGRYRSEQVVTLVLISGGGPSPLAPKIVDTQPQSFPSLLWSYMKPVLTCDTRRDILYTPRGKHMEPSDLFSSGVPQYVLQHIANGQIWPEGDATFHRRILVPTLLVHGLHDPLVTLVQECEMERTIPRSFLEVIPDAGHLPMIETPSECSHMIHCFIEWWNQ